MSCGSILFTVGKFVAQKAFEQILKKVGIPPKLAGPIATAVGGLADSQLEHKR